MPSLMKCRLCGRIFTNGGRASVCRSCLMRLENLYTAVHEHMRDHKDEVFDIYQLAENLGATTADVQALVDLGYLERDMSLYGTRETDRSKLANELTAELEKMKRRKVTTYGGEIYARNTLYNKRSDNN